MAKKGERKSEKRLSTSKVRKVRRKERTWTIRSKPGPHSRKKSIPLGMALRDILGKGKTLKEVKFILNSKKIKVDGRIVKNYRFPIGLFDMISIDEEKKNYLTIFDDGGRFTLKETKDAGKLRKLCKVTGKKVGKKGVIQLVSNDGRTFEEKKTQCKVGDSLEIELPTQKILNRLELKKGNFVYISGGTHIGEQAKITDIIEGTMKRPKLVALKPEGKDEFQTIGRNVFVIGDKKLVIK